MINQNSNIFTPPTLVTNLNTTSFDIQGCPSDLIDFTVYTANSFPKILPFYLQCLKRNPPPVIPISLLCCATYASLFPESYKEIVEDLKARNRSQLTSWFTHNVNIHPALSFMNQEVALLTQIELDNISNEEVSGSSISAFYSILFISLIVIKDKDYSTYKQFVTRRFTAALKKKDNTMVVTEPSLDILGFQSVLTENTFIEMKKLVPLSLLFVFPIFVKFYDREDLLSGVPLLFIEQMKLIAYNSRFTQMNEIINTLCNDATIQILHPKFPSIINEINLLAQNYNNAKIRLGQLTPYIRSFIDLTQGKFYARDYPNLTSLYIIYVEKNENKGNYTLNRRNQGLMNSTSQSERAYKLLTEGDQEQDPLVQTILSAIQSLQNRNR